MHQNKSFLLKEIANTPYLLPYGQMIADHKKGIRLNPTGAYLWELLATERSLQELLELGASHYEITADEFPSFKEDVTQFINQLLELHIVEDGILPVSDDSQIFLFSVGSLSLKLVAPQTVIPSELQKFATDSAPVIHQQIHICIGSPAVRPNGMVLLRNKELVVIETENEYCLLFPQMSQMIEMHLKKDGTLAVCYLLPPFTDALKTDLFHAIRLPFLYLAQKKGMVAIHSASIFYKGKAWLFSGHSGAGKSTHTNLWKHLYSTPILNGDLNLLSVRDGQVLLYGIPWCGTSGICDTHTYPVGGIILLRQATQDSIEELSYQEKQLLIAQRFISPAWTADMLVKNLEIAQELAERLLICRLHCTKEPSSVQLIKDYILHHLK